MAKIITTISSSVGSFVYNILHKVINITLSELGITTTNYTKEEIETAVTTYRQTLPFDAVYDILVTENLQNLAFDVTANWIGNGVTDENSFIIFLSLRGISSPTISNFRLLNGRLTCDLEAQSGNTLDFNSLEITIIKSLGYLSTFTVLNLDDNQINSLLDFIVPFSLQSFILTNNSFTNASYTASEVWANNLTPFVNPCTIDFTGNIDSVIGTNLESILITKNCIVNG